MKPLVALILLLPRFRWTLRTITTRRASEGLASLPRWRFGLDPLFPRWRFGLVWIAVVTVASGASTATAQPPAGPEGKSVKHWADQLKSTEFREQWYAAYVLGTLGPQAAPAASALHAVLEVKSNNEYSRSMAAWALGRIGPAAEPEIRFLTETMRTTTLLAVRRSTVEALGNFAAAAKPAVSELLKMLGNDDEITRVNASVALWKIDRHPKALPALLEMLRPGNSSQAYAAAVALGQMEEEADVAAPALIAALHAPAADVRRAAARSLGQLGKAAFPALQKANALRDPDANVRRLSSSP